MSPARRVANRFEIRDLEHDLLGRGGMGALYRAIDTLTGELVAVKALDPHSSPADGPSGALHLRWTLSFHMHCEQ